MKMASNAKSKPTVHRGTTEEKSASEYHVQLHPGAKPGEWQGKFVPTKSEAQRKAAQAAVAKLMNPPLSPAARSIDG